MCLFSEGKDFGKINSLFLNLKIRKVLLRIGDSDFTKESYKQKLQTKNPLGIPETFFKSENFFKNYKHKSPILILESIRYRLYLRCEILHISK